MSYTEAPCLGMGATSRRAGKGLLDVPCPRVRMIVTGAFLDASPCDQCASPGACPDGLRVFPDGAPYPPFAPQHLVRLRRSSRQKRRWQVRGR